MKMKLMMLVGLTISIALFGNLTAQAQTTTPSGYQEGEFSGTRNFLTGVPAGFTPKVPFDQAKTKILAALDKKITELGQVPAKIDANTNLTDEQKAALKAKAQAAIAKFTDIRNKVQTAQSYDDLLKIVQDHIKGGAALMGVSQSGNAQAMQSMVNNLKLQGADTEDLQNEVDDLKEAVKNADRENATPEDKAALQQQWQMLQQKIKLFKQQHPSLVPSRNPKLTGVVPTLSAIPSIRASITGPMPSRACPTRPPCLDAVGAQRCMIAEPAEGWCPVTQ